MRRLETTTDLLDAIQERHELESDNQVAIAFGIPQGTVSNWRRGRTFPTPQHAITIARALEISPLVVLAIAAADRCSDRPSKEVWQRMVGNLVRAIAAGVIGTGALSIGYAPPAKAADPGLYIMTNMDGSSTGTMSNEPSISAQHERRAARACIRHLQLCMLLVCTLYLPGVQAEVFRCPSPQGISYFAYLESPSREEALKRAQAEWNFKFLSQPQACMTDAEFSAAYQAAFDNSAHWKEMTRIRTPAGPMESDCGQLPREGEPYKLAIARVLEAPQGCDRVLTIEQQFFVAGASQQLLGQCDIAVSSVDGRVMKFLLLAEASALTGVHAIRQGQGPEAAAARTGKEIAEARTPSLAGVAYAKGLGNASCQKEFPKHWFAGVKNYLNDTSQSPAAEFVGSCVAYYRNTVTSSSCECLGDSLRISHPWIFTGRLDPDQLREGSLTTLAGALACGIHGFDRPPAPTPDPATNTMRLQRSACDRFSEQGTGSKVPEERQALIERCMAADATEVIQLDAKVREAAAQKTENYRRMRENRHADCEQAATHIKQTDSGPNGNWVHNQLQRSFISACSFNLDNNWEVIRAPPEEWCRQLDALVTTYRGLRNSSSGPLLDSQLTDLVAAYRKHCDAGGDVITGKAMPSR